MKENFKYRFSGLLPFMPLFFWLFFCLPVFGGGLRPVLNTEGAMVSSACYSMSGTRFAIFYNPALLPEIHSSSLSLEAYRPYNLGDLSNASIGFVWHTSSGPNYAVLLNQLSNSAYKETQFSLSGGIILSRNMNLGIRFNAWQFWIKGYQSTRSFSADAALNWKFNSRLTAAIVFSNILARNMDGINTGQQPEAVLETGYRFTNRARISVQAYQDAYHRLMFRLGTIVQPVKFVRTGIGISPDARQWSGGFSIIQHNFQFNYALMMHDTLGETHTIGLTYSW